MRLRQYNSCRVKNLVHRIMDMLARSISELNNGGKRGNDIFK